jgi:hypothetical protein
LEVSGGVVKKLDDYESLAVETLLFLKTWNIHLLRANHPYKLDKITTYQNLYTPSSSQIN